MRGIKLKKWQVLQSKTLIKNQWISVKCDSCINGNGLVIPSYYWVEGKDYVVVLGTTTEGKVVMIEQYRHGVKEILQEFPGGIIEKGECPEETAKRELYEETGYIANDIILKKEIYSAPASLSTKGYLFFARNLINTGVQHLDKEEEINIKLVDFDSLQELIDNNIINSAFGVAAAYLAIQAKNWFF